MITLNIGSPPSGKGDAVNRETIVWIIQALFQIQRHLQASDANVVYDAYTVSNLSAGVRTLDVGTAALADVTNVLATLIQDFRTRGPKGV